VALEPTSPISTPNSTACRSALRWASSGKVKNMAAPVALWLFGVFSKRFSARITTGATASRLGPRRLRAMLARMCGRVRLSSDVSEIKLVFSIPPHRPTPNFPPSWNVAPTDPLPVVRYDAKAGERSLDPLRWGLVPFWAKDIKVGFANINAKAEGIENKPAFREAFQRRRCLVPVENFYEWKKKATGKQPYAIALVHRGLMALAGLWENWRSPAGEWIRSFAIVTTAPNELCAELHNRMPVVLAPETWPAWLGEEPVDAPQLKALLAPLPIGGNDVLAGQPAGRKRQEQ